jgi:DNA topoisomerase-2
MTKNAKTVEETYKKMSQLEHILHRPSMYVGTIEKTPQDRWVFVESGTEDPVKVGSFSKKPYSFSPALYKIIDEIVANATDHSQRDPTVRKIEININSIGEITVLNDGSNIPIDIHKDLNKYVPDIIFGEFHTSSNYDDSEARLVAGTNGFGAKLTNAFSKYFTVVICTGTHQYTQTWRDNMSVREEPVIKAKNKKQSVSISFLPDYDRFGGFNLDELTEVLKTRAYEASAITNKSVGVAFNSNRLSVKCFEDFANLFIGGKATPRVHIQTDRWDCIVCLNTYDRFTQVSFVNGNNTADGGTHVDYIVNQIINHSKEVLEKKHKDLAIRPSFIKDNLLIFLNCTIENPVFSSQTKEQHTTRPQKFGSTCVFTDDIFKKIDKLGILDNVVQMIQAKEQKSLSKTDGKKQNRISGIPKLDDANKAGGSEGHKCKLILTEGDSAKASALAGLSVIGRDYYGVFPLRGKLLNVRDATAAQLLKNEEINALKKILGLQQNKEYTDTKHLRYGGILIFTDADNDGSHIKGLIINFIHTFWPSLIKIDAFISSIITPIVKVSKGKTVIPFYNQSDFENWRTSNAIGSWNVKYYKGLGTSTALEAKEYFKNLSNQTIRYSFTASTDSDLIKAFKKGFEDARKDWIKESTGKELSLDFSRTKQSISEFVNTELIQFSIADLERSIPNVMDGLKPSQRKVLYGCFKKKLTVDTKVAQLSGYISEHTSYHHGETSLQGTIINMAQDFVGSNNINLLVPSGQFGSRLIGGSDAASPRYIFTRLNPITKVLFNEYDSALLEYLDDDGMSIEPKYYIPIIPMLLVNGSQGIGTGYSTTIPCYNPADIIENLHLLIESNGTAAMKPMIPWYKGFKGTILPDTTPGKYITLGVWSRKTPTTIEVSELPIGKWTQNYKEFLEELVEKNEIVDYKNNSDDCTVNFTITMQKTVIDDLIAKNKVIDTLKLSSSINTSNMHVFDADCKIRKVQCAEEIILLFYIVRKEHYAKRKKYLLDTLESDIALLRSKMNFILYVLNKQIKIYNYWINIIINNKNYKVKKYNKLRILK